MLGAEGDGGAADGAAVPLVGLRQAESSDSGGHKEGGAGQGGCGPRVEDQSAV